MRGSARLLAALDPAHHPAARGDEPGSRALADDGDGPLGHDDDAERVREGAVERRRHDRRQRLDRVARRAAASSCSRLVPTLASASAVRTWRATRCRRRATSIVAQRRRPTSRARRSHAASAAREQRERERAASGRRGRAEPASRRPPRSRARNGTTTLAARARGRDARSPRPPPAMRRCSPRRGRARSLLRRRAPATAEQHDLVLELDAVLLARAAAALRHQRQAVGGRRPAGVLDEVRVLRRDERAADAVALEPAELEQPPGAELARRVLEDRAERALVRRLRRLPPRDEVGDSALISLGGRGVEPVLDAGDDLAVPQARSAGRRGRARPASASRRRRPSTTSARSRTAAQSRPYAPAFIHTPPPAVPGIAQANSKPPRPAARARCRQTAFVAPPPATSTPSPPPCVRQLAREPQHERVDARRRRRARSSRARPTTTSSPAPRAQRERLLELGQRPRPRERARRPAGADRRQPRRARRPPRASRRQRPSTIARAIFHGSPTPNVTTTSPGRAHASAIVAASSSDGAHPARTCARQRVERRACPATPSRGSSRAPSTSVTIAASASPSACPSSRGELARPLVRRAAGRRRSAARASARARSAAWPRARSGCARSRRRRRLPPRSPTSSKRRPTPVKRRAPVRPRAVDACAARAPPAPRRRSAGCARRARASGRSTGSSSHAAHDVRHVPRASRSKQSRELGLGGVGRVVVELDVRDDRDLGTKREDRPVGLVALDDEPARPRSRRCRRAAGRRRRRSTPDRGRVSREREGDHRRRRRLAVRAADDDRRPQRRRARRGSRPAACPRRGACARSETTTSHPSGAAARRRGRPRRPSSVSSEDRLARVPTAHLGAPGPRDVRVGGEAGAADPDEVEPAGRRAQRAARRDQLLRDLVGGVRAAPARASPRAWRASRAGRRATPRRARDAGRASASGTTRAPPPRSK